LSFDAEKVPYEFAEICRSDDTGAIKTNVFFQGFSKRHGFINLSTLTPDKICGHRIRKAAARSHLDVGI